MMDPNLSRVSGMNNALEYPNWNISPNLILDPFPDLGYDPYSSSGMDEIPNFLPDPYANELHSPSIWGPNQDQLSPSDENDSSNPLLKYVSQILMEENIGDKPCLFYDSLALQQTEEMLQQVIGDSKTQSHSSHDESTTSISSSSDFRSGNSNSSGNSISSDAGNSADSVMVRGHFDRSQFVSNLDVPGSNTVDSLGDWPTESNVNEMLVRSMYTDTESVLQFQKGVEEASKFLPSSDRLIINIEPENHFPSGERQEVPKPVFVKEENLILSEFSRVRKLNDREESHLEETRNHKQSAMHVEDWNLTEMFDKVLLLDAKCDPTTTMTYVERSLNGLGPGKTQAKKDGRRRKRRSETADFRTLLMLCAQAISSGDKTTAYDILRQIKQGSSAFGDASQRVAHHFANALEARLQGASGPGIQNYYCAITSTKVVAADILKAYQAFLSASPFKTLMYFFANKMIIDAAKDASVLHIVDFGILYGFQWPMFIQFISKREGGPPKLRITGIEFPQRGLRPAERIEETGKRLAEYCRRFGVPFEFNAIASQKWETIRISDIKIQGNEVLAVNTSLRLKNLLDETAGEENCPRDAILRLIRDMNPDVFVPAVVNGSFNAPFFTSRFKEALFHYSTLFDMFDSALPRDNPERIRFEREFYGREVMNVIACEGVERVERPETYRQWQVRMMRAGFKQKPVENELVEKFRGKMKRWGYHKDFVLDEDGDWFLQCWKGRILYASSCWVPA